MNVFVLLNTKEDVLKNVGNRAVHFYKYRIFKIHLRVSHTGLLLWQHFHALKRDDARNKLWLVVWHLGQMASWAGLGQWTPSVWRSGYARLGHHYNFFPAMEVNGAPEQPGYKLSAKLFSFVFGRTKKFIWVWKYLRTSKWWHNFHFWVNCPLNVL